jgi:hypothetical protein
MRELTVGARVLLPSGNVLELVEWENGEWVCLYTARATARGTVLYTEKFLLAYAKIL